MQVEPKKVTALKSIPSDGKFTANGKNYSVQGRFSFKRWRAFKKLQVEAGYGESLTEHQDKLGQIYEAVNETRFADAAVMTQGLMQGVANLDESRYEWGLKICMLFVNYEGEDLARWDDDLMNEKLTDMEVEGMDVQDFFQLGFTSIPGFMKIYENFTQGTSKEKSKIEGKGKKS